MDTQHGIHMSQRIAKSAILAASLARQEDLIRHYDQRLEEISADAYTHAETPSQTDEGSTSAEDLIEAMGKELLFVKSELEILRSIDPENGADSVERGAVVITDRRTFFISVSSEEMEINGNKVFGMSERAPLYNQMKGLKKGDSFAFNNMSYQIIDVY